jgi:hypothetical protein
MVVRAGARLDATDFALPDVVAATAGGTGTNTITATSWAVLPSNTCTAAITNPHPEMALLVEVTYSAWMVATANGVRMALDISGSVTIAPGVGAGAAVGWGEIPFCGAATTNQYAGSFTVELPVSTTAATFKVYAYRDAASGTQQVNYPTIRIKPLRFVEA